MLQYLYTYEIFNHGLTTATSFQLLIIGDKYELEELRDIGIQNLSNEIANLTERDAQWAAEWYPQISQLEQKGTQPIKTQLANLIAKHAREMIKHDRMRELVASDGALAVTLVEKLASPAPAMFAKMEGSTSKDWFNSAPRFGSSAGSTAATFGSAGSLTPTF
jgi:hypothetical protein